MSSHPSTGSRIQSVSQDMTFYPKREYTASTGNFPRVKQLVSSLPAAKPKPGFLILAKQGASPRTNLPAEFKDFQANGFAIAYPASWAVGAGKPGSSMYIVPQGGVAEGKKGETELLAGAMLDYYVPQGGAASAKVDGATKQFLDDLRKGDANMRASQSEHTTIGGQPAIMTRITTKTSSQQEPDQVVSLYTVERDAGLWYAALATPSVRAGQFEPVFQQMVKTVEFPK
jgi:hypothetical protein